MDQTLNDLFKRKVELANRAKCLEIESKICAHRYEIQLRQLLIELALVEREEMQLEETDQRAEPLIAPATPSGIGS